MTNDEAEKMLKELAAHFGEAVQPASRYCEALRTWGRVVTEHSRDDGPNSLASAIGTIEATLHKSNLAARLVYGGEKLRTQKCPDHKGHWVGIEFPEMYCKHGCQFTGWLPEPEDKPPYPPGVFVRYERQPDGTMVGNLTKDGQPYTPGPGEPPWTPRVIEPTPAVAAS